MAITKTFHLRVKARSPAHYVYFTESANEKLENYLFGNQNSNQEIQLKFITGKVQEGLSKEQVSKIDYLAGAGLFHFFSPKFIDSMQEILQDEVVFNKITLLAGDEKFDFYLANVINKMNVIDHALSKTYDTQGGFPPTIFRNEFEKPFFIARESEPLRGSTVIVSEEFREICIKKKFNINFKETLTTLPS